MGCWTPTTNFCFSGGLRLPTKIYHTTPQIVGILPQFIHRESRLGISQSSIYFSYWISTNQLTNQFCARSQYLNLATISSQLSSLFLLWYSVLSVSKKSLSTPLPVLWDQNSHEQGRAGSSGSKPGKNDFTDQCLKTFITWCHWCQCWGNFGSRIWEAMENQSKMWIWQDVRCHSGKWMLLVVVS